MNLWICVTKSECPFMGTWKECIKHCDETGHSIFELLEYTLDGIL